MTDGGDDEDENEGRRRQRHREIAPVGDGIDGEERRRVEERLRLLVVLSEATRGDADPLTIMATTNRMVAEHLHVTRCLYGDVERDSNHLTVRQDWQVPGAKSLVGPFVLEDFGARVTAVLRGGETLVIRHTDEELASGEGLDAFRAIGVQASICTPLVKEGQLVAVMAVHCEAPRDWTTGDIALVEEVAERCWAHIERVHAASELLQAARQKDDFLATLAHELRNPLAPIRSALDVLMRSPPGPDAERAKTTMDRQLSHLTRLVDDLLDISRITRGKLDLRTEPIDTRAVIDAAVEASRAFIEASGHQLMITLPVGKLPLDADVTRLAQVVTNLLKNAAKYTLGRGRIDLVVEREPGLIVLHVKDNGTGIAAKDLPHLFDAFPPVLVTRSPGGLGIGLSLVKKLVEMHGGTVSAASAGIGHGSTFTVRLPLGTVVQPISAPPESSIRVGLPGMGTVTAPTGRRVLVVDDSADAAEMLAMMLRLEGHRARVAHDGPSAIADLREEPCEVVFLDIGMPDMDGFDVARQLRDDPAFAGLKIVALSGWGSAEDKERAKDAGFDSHMTKPINAEAVQALLAKLFA